MVKPNKNNTLPEDSGWAWAVAAAGFLAHMVMSGSNQTNSVLFVEILRKYDTSITTASLMFMCHSMTYALGSVIVSNFVMPKLQERGCIIVGGLMCFAISVCASFAPNIGVFIAVICMKGFAHGFIVLPSISLIRFYFKKMRSRASMIPWCGACAGSIIGPFVIRAIKKEFGVSGAYLILSAVELHLIVAGLLLRPLSAYRFLPEEVGNILDDKTASRSPSAASDETNHTQEDVDPIEKSTLLLPDVGSEVFLTELNTDRIDASVDEKINTKVIDLTDATRNRGVFAHRERRNTFRGSVLTLDSEFGIALEAMGKDVTDSPADKGLTRWQKIYKASSLELRSFRWALLSLLPGTVNVYLSSYLPTISNSRGASLDQAALLVTIRSTMDLISRIIMGFILDTNVISPSKLLVISQLCMGVACQFFRLTSSFTTLIPITVFIGMFIGSRGPIITLLVLEVVGTEKMPQAYSIVSMLATMTGALFNPMLGSVVEATGSFVTITHIIGTCYILCGVMLSLLPLFTRLDIKHGRKDKT